MRDVFCSDHGEFSFLCIANFTAEDIYSYRHPCAHLKDVRSHNDGIYFVSFYLPLSNQFGKAYTKHTTGHIAVDNFFLL